MNQYLKWNEQNITDFSQDNINRLYNDGYLFGRTKKGYMYQTRSLRIDLSKFNLSSENRRVFRKTENTLITSYELPIANYHWSIGKMAKDFYTTKFGDGTFSANKIKELFTVEHNFNRLFEYTEGRKKKDEPTEQADEKQIIGYAICSETNEILHYSYPFYNLQSEINNVGMSMMLHAILFAQENKKKYLYLGSATRPTDTYKLQFEGLEWFDGKSWQVDNIGILKHILAV